MGSVLWEQLGATFLLHFFRRRRCHCSRLNWFVPDTNIFLFAQHQYFYASSHCLVEFFSHINVFTRRESAVLNILVVLDTHSARILACIIFTIISFSPDIPSMLSDKSDLWSRKMSNNWLNSTPLYFTPTTSETSESADRYSEVLDITWRGTSRSWENFLRRKVSYIEDHV